MTAGVLHRTLMCASLLAVLTAGCTSASDRQSDADRSGSESPTVDASMEPDETEVVGVSIGQVPVRQWERMVEAGMIRPGCPITKRGQLRRVDVPFVDFTGRIRQGHLIVNRDAASSVGAIFGTLFEIAFPIARMHGVERYGGDSDASLRANNTSAYNCRRLDQINAPPLASPHANGRAIDINPVQNPWRDLRCRCWSPTKEFASRTAGPGKILKGDPVWRLFVDAGWIWQDIDVPDYMHFDTGYPSAPLRRPGPMGTGAR